MLILNEGRRLVLGDADCAAAQEMFTGRQRLFIFGAVAIALPLSLLSAIEPGALKDPAAALGFALRLLLLAGVLVGLRYISNLVVMSGEVVAAAFDRDRAVIEIITFGALGANREYVPFSEVRGIRLTRGEWNGESASSIPVVELVSKRMIALPEELGTRDLTLLKVLTGLRGP